MLSAGPGDIVIWDADVSHMPKWQSHLNIISHPYVLMSYYVFFNY